MMNPCPQGSYNLVPKELWQNKELERDIRVFRAWKSETMLEKWWGNQRGLPEGGSI